MQWECRLTERSLLADGAVTRPEATQHLASCERCRRAVASYAAARRALAAHHAGLEPDSGFSARVIERLAVTPPGLAALGWAAQRLLPIAVALVLVVAGWGATREHSSPIDALLWQGASDEQLVAFLLSSDGGDR